MSTAARPESFRVAFFDEDRARRNFNGYIDCVVGYARLSFDEDGEGYCSIVNQREILREFYKRQFENADSRYVFVADDNVSGYKFEREGLFEVLRRIEDGTCNVLIAKDLSRIGRHGALTQLFIEQCERVGVRVVAMDDYDSHKESDELILGIRAWSNERLVKDTSAKILKIVRHKQKAGTWFCAAPFGYRVLDYARGLVEIDEESAAIMRRIGEMFVSGCGVNRIARVLSDEGVPTPSAYDRNRAIAEGKEYKKQVSARWSGGQIAKMLDDDFYIGTLRTGKYKRQGINGRDARTSREDQYVFHDHHPAIWTKELFEEIQSIRTGRRAEKYRGVKKNESLFHGLLQCGECGHRLYAYFRSDLARQYICSTHFKYGKSACSRHMIKEETLVRIALAYLRQIRDAGADVLASLDQEVREARRTEQKNRISLDALKREEEGLRKQLVVIESQRVKQILKHPEREDSLNAIYDEMHATAEASIERLNREMEALSEAGIGGVEVVQKAKTALEIIDGIIARRDLCRRDVVALFERIVVHEDGRVLISLKSDLGLLQYEDMTVADRAVRQPEKVYAVEAANVVREGDPLEIFTDHDGEVVLKKYSPIGEIAAIAKDYTDSLYRTLGHVALICDRDTVVSSSGAAKREYIEKPLSTEVDQLLQARQFSMLNLSEGARMLPVTNDDHPESYTAQIIAPILADGEIIGGLMLLSRETGVSMTDIDRKVAETTANIVGRQMEQ